MNTHAFLARPVKRAIYGFMGLMAVAIVLAVAAKSGAIVAPFEKRALGILIGVLVIVMGNLLPKLRPLNQHGGDPARAASAERLAGWLLVLAGIAYTALFVFAPLDRARPISSVIGIGVIIVITVSWARLVIAALSRRQHAAPSATPDKRATEQRKVVGWLVLAFFYVFATACVSFLFKDQRWFHDLASWMLVGACIAYALLGNAWSRGTPCAGPTVQEAERKPQ